MIPMMVLTGGHTVLGAIGFRDNQANCLMEQVPHRRIAFLSFQLPVYGLTLWITGAASYRDRNPACHDRCVNADYQSTFGLFLQTMRRLAGVGLE